MAENIVHFTEQTSATVENLLDNHAITGVSQRAVLGVTQEENKYVVSDTITQDSNIEKYQGFVCVVTCFSEEEQRASLEQFQTDGNRKNVFLATVNYDKFELFHLTEEREVASVPFVFDPAKERSMAA